MIAYINVNNFHENNLYFSDVIKNTIIINGKFIRLTYSHNNTIFNGLYIMIPINIINKEYSNYINIKKNSNYKTLLADIENKILDKYNISKNKVFKLTEQLTQNSIKIFNNDNNNNNITKIIIKISGLWEDDNNYGLTYKFINYN